MKRFINASNSSSGSVLTESAIVLPILIALVVGILEYSHIYFAKSELQASVEKGLELATVVNGLEFVTDGINEPAKLAIRERVMDRASAYYSNGAEDGLNGMPRVNYGRRITEISLDIGEDGVRTDLSRYLQENPMKLTVTAEIPSLLGINPASLVTSNPISSPTITVTSVSAMYRESSFSSNISRIFNCRGEEIFSGDFFDPSDPEVIDFINGNFPSPEDCGCQDDPNDITRIASTGVCECRPTNPDPATYLGNGWVHDSNANRIPDCERDPADPGQWLDPASCQDPDPPGDQNVDAGECICNPVNAAGDLVYITNSNGDCECLPCNLQNPRWLDAVGPAPNTCACSCPPDSFPWVNVNGDIQCGCHPLLGGDDCGCDDDAAFKVEVCDTYINPATNETYFYEEVGDGQCLCELRCEVTLNPGDQHPNSFSGFIVEDPSDPRLCICDTGALGSYDCTGGNPDVLYEPRNDPDFGEYGYCGCDCPDTAEADCLGRGDNYIFQGGDCLCKQCEGNLIRDPANPSQCICPDVTCEDSPTQYQCNGNLCGCNDCSTAMAGANNPTYWIRGSSNPTIDCDDSLAPNGGGICVCDWESLLEDVCIEGQGVNTELCKCVGCIDGDEGCNCETTECTGANDYLCGATCSCEPCPQYTYPDPGLKNDNSASCAPLGGGSPRCLCDVQAIWDNECDQATEIVDPDTCQCVPCPDPDQTPNGGPGNPAISCDCPSPPGSLPAEEYYCSDNCETYDCTSWRQNHIAINQFLSTCKPVNQNCECDEATVVAQCLADSAADPVLDFRFSGTSTCGCIPCDTDEQVTPDGRDCECITDPTCPGLGAVPNPAGCDCICDPAFPNYVPVECPPDLAGELCCAEPCPPGATCEWLPGGGYGVPE